MEKIYIKPRWNVIVQTKIKSNIQEGGVSEEPSAKNREPKWKIK
jgi:hypothetical protein